MYYSETVCMSCSIPELPELLGLGPVLATPLRCEVDLRCFYFSAQNKRRTCVCCIFFPPFVYFGCNHAGEPSPSASVNTCDRLVIVPEWQNRTRVTWCGCRFENSVHVPGSFWSGFPTAGWGKHKEPLCQSGRVDHSTGSVCTTLSTLAGKICWSWIVLTLENGTTELSIDKTPRKALNMDRQASSAAILSMVFLSAFAEHHIVSALLVFKSPLLGIQCTNKLFTRISQLPLRP